MGPYFANLVLISENYQLGSVVEGDIWRLVTWPIPNEPHFWTIILFAIFYMLGSQIESLLGRWRFAFFLVALTLIPAVIVTAVEAVAGVNGYVAGYEWWRSGCWWLLPPSTPTPGSGRGFPVG